MTGWRMDRGMGTPTQHPLSQHTFVMFLYLLVCFAWFQHNFLFRWNKPCFPENSHLLTAFLQEIFVTQINSLSSLCLFSLQAGFCLSLGPGTGRTGNATTAHLQAVQQDPARKPQSTETILLDKHPTVVQHKSVFCERLDASRVLKTGASVNVGMSWLCPEILKCQFPQEEIPTDPGCHLEHDVPVRKTSSHLVQPWNNSQSLHRDLPRLQNIECFLCSSLHLLISHRALRKDSAHDLLNKI